MAEAENTLFLRALTQPVNAIAYTVLRELSALYPDKAILYGDVFPLEAFVQDEKCTARLCPSPLPQFETNWHSKKYGISHTAEHAVYEVFWNEHNLTVYLLRWNDGNCSNRYFWIVAETRGIAEEFYVAAKEWDSEVRGEILVFDQGYWYKSEDLYDAIKGARFDNLILPGQLKTEIQTDFQQFFESRAVYERYRIPWKRGVLLIGPPGNGKTHTVKALLNWLGQPCLYVKSFKARYATDHENIHKVFERARQTTPCILVMEDLDALVNDKNRSFFLNELDGFAANTGIVLVATTNHPEKLDTAILDRPSRFDRKYHFDLPASAERHAYMTAWNTGLETDMQLSPAIIEELTILTEGFSFAYLKELILSAMMRWIAAPQSGRMDRVAVEQAGVLRQQMSSMNDTATVDYTEEEDDEEY